jgi:hypothetical protein
MSVRSTVILSTGLFLGAACARQAVGDDDSHAEATGNAEETSGPTGGQMSGGDVPELGPCARYIECVMQVTPEAVSGVVATYGELGSCWELPGVQEEHCWSDCRGQMTLLRELHPDEEACWECSSNEDCPMDRPVCSSVTHECEPGPTPGECFHHEECDSGYCLAYQDAPPDPNAFCERPPPGGATRFTGRVLDVETLAPLPGATVDALAALDAITNPTGASALVTGVTDGEGRFDMTSSGPVSAAIAVFGRIEAPGHTRALTPMASPVDSSYGPGNDVRDLWAIEAATVDAWSSALSSDPSLTEYLPLLDRGGTVLVVRDATTGIALPNASFAPTDPSAPVHVRYLEATGASFGPSSTTSSGIAIVLGAPTTGVTLDVVVNGAPTGTTVGAGSTNNAIVVAGVDVLP